MTGSRYPVKRDTTDLLSHPDQGLSEMERQQEIADRGGGGTFTPYAISIQRLPGLGNQTIASASLPLIQFDYSGGYDPVYFEQKGDLSAPPIGSAVPPAASDSMWSDGDKNVIYLPVTGLWGFRANYLYNALPAGVSAETVIHLSGSPVALSEGAGTGNDLDCSCVGTCYGTAGDWLGVRTRHTSGSSQAVKVSGAGGPNDEPGHGPVFSVWLIAATS